MTCLLYGENTFAIDDEKKRRTHEYLLENDALGLELLDGEEVTDQRLRDAVLQLPFLVSRKLVIVRSPFANKAVGDTLTAIFELIPDEVDVLLIEPKPDKRTKFFKLLQSKKALQEFPLLKGSALLSWLTEYAAENNSTLDTATAQYLIDRVGVDQLNLASEVRKLSFLSPITKAAIDELTTQTLQATVFELLELVFSGDTDRALALYDTLLANKTDPNELMGLIAWQLHVFALVLHSGEKESSRLASVTGLHPFVAGKAQKSLRSFSPARLKESVSRALAVDESIKTGVSQPEEAVRVLLLELSIG